MKAQAVVITFKNGKTWIGTGKALFEGNLVPEEWKSIKEITYTTAVDLPKGYHISYLDAEGNLIEVNA